MSDESIAGRIERLVAEERELRTREQADSTHVEALEADRERLRAVEVELDRCWDLLRQRRAPIPTTRTCATPRRSSATSSSPAPPGPIIRPLPSPAPRSTAERWLVSGRFDPARRGLALSYHGEDGLAPTCDMAATTR